MTANVTRTARQLLNKYALRSGDAIQLGSACTLAEAVGPLEAFVAFDVRLVDAAASEGLNTIRI